MLVGDAGQVEFEGVALLQAVTGLHVDVDEVEGFLGAADDPGVLGRDVAAIPRAASSSFSRGTTSYTDPKCWSCGGDVLRREVQRAHHVLRDEPGEVGGGAECAAVDLGQSEDGVVGRDDHVGVADQADAAADAEAVDRGHHGHGAVVDGGEGGGAAAVGVDQRAVAVGGLHFLDVDAGVEPASLRSQDHHVGVRIPARVGTASANSNQPRDGMAFTGG